MAALTVVGAGDQGCCIIAQVGTGLWLGVGRGLYTLGHVATSLCLVVLLQGSRVLGTRNLMSSVTFLLSFVVPLASDFRWRCSGVSSAVATSSPAPGRPLILLEARISGGQEFWVRWPGFVFFPLLGLRYVIAGLSHMARGGLGPLGPVLGHVLPGGAQGHGVQAQQGHRSALGRILPLHCRRFLGSQFILPPQSTFTLVGWWYPVGSCHVFVIVFSQVDSAVSAEANVSVFVFHFRGFS